MKGKNKVINIEKGNNEKNKLMIINKSSISGITLIALVVTIIVLIILATIGINGMLGQNGILKKAEEVKLRTEQAKEIEIIKMSYATCKHDYIIEDTKITSSKLQEEISKTKGAMVREVGAIPEESIVVNNGENGGLIFEVSMGYGTYYLYSGEGGDSSYIEAKDIEESVYVNYVDAYGKKILCRVLYDASSEYGLQIVSLSNVTNITLGYQGNDISAYRNWETSYNGAIKKLNDTAKKYVNTKYSPEGGARCFGSVPNDPYSESDYVTFRDGTLDSIIGGVIDSDENYLIDWNQRKRLGIEEPSTSYWFASRGKIEDNYDNASFYGIICSNDIDYSGIIEYDGIQASVSYSWGDYSPEFQFYSKSKTNGLCPVFTLKPDVKFVSGDGSKENPYELEDLTTDSLQIGEYIKYIDKNGKEILCRVLYDNKYNAINSKKYGIQIIADKTVRDVTLGATKGVTNEEKFEEGVYTYNNSIKILNDIAMEYINTTYSPEGGARCVGSKPDDPYDDITEKIELENKKYKGKFKGISPTVTMLDVFELDHLEDIGMDEINSEYWLSSRIYMIDKKQLLGGIATIVRGNSYKTQYLFSIQDCQTAYGEFGYSWTSGFRPVFTLKHSMPITGGDGTKSNPYTLN